MVHILTIVEKASMFNRHIKEYYFNNYIDTCLEKDDQQILPIRDIYEDCKAWQTENKIPAFFGGIRDFSRCMSRKGYTSGIGRVLKDGEKKVTRVFMGVRLKRT